MGQDRKHSRFHLPGPALGAFLLKAFGIGKYRRNKKRIAESGEEIGKKLLPVKRSLLLFFDVVKKRRPGAGSLPFLLEILNGMAQKAPVNILPHAFIGIFFYVMKERGLCLNFGKTFKFATDVIVTSRHQNFFRQIGRIALPVSQI